MLEVNLAYFIFSPYAFAVSHINILNGKYIYIYIYILSYRNLLKANLAKAKIVAHF